jgi:hypothetical protein
MGLAYGWILNPVAAADTTPSSLRIDYQTDYVLMVAETFRSSQDLELAKRQLAILGSRPPADIAAAAAQQARLANYAPEDLTSLNDLVQAIQSSDAADLSGEAPP